MFCLSNQRGGAGLRAPLRASSPAPLPSIAGWPFSLQKSRLTLTGEKDSERQKRSKSKYLHALGETRPHQCGKVHRYWVCLQRNTVRSDPLTKNKTHRKLTSFESHGVPAHRFTRFGVSLVPASFSVPTPPHAQVLGLLSHHRLRQSAQGTSATSTPQGKSPGAKLHKERLGYPPSGGSKGFADPLPSRQWPPRGKKL